MQQGILAQGTGFGLLYTLLIAGVFLLAACTRPTPRIDKIGLIAPFEGLYRDTGYAALAGVRYAIEQCSPEGTAVLPVALDDSHGFETTLRAQDKLNVDPAVLATLLVSMPLSVPLDSQSGPDVEYARDLSGRSGLTSSQVAPLSPVVFPLMVTAGGQFAGPPTLASALTRYIHEIAAAVGQQTNWDRLLVAGAPQAILSAPDIAPSNTQAGTRAAPIVPLVTASDSPQEIPAAVAGKYRPGDVLLWLEPGTNGSSGLQALRQSFPNLPIILGPHPGNLILTRHLDTQNNVYWAVWSNDEYTEWAGSQAGIAQMPANDETMLISHRIAEQLTQASTGDETIHRYTYLVYHAACSRLRHAPDESQPARQTAVDEEWRVYLLTPWGMEISAASTEIQEPDMATPN